MFRHLCLLLLIWANSASAFPCYITFMKGDCWKNYDVTITTYDNGDNEEELASVILKKDNLWNRKKLSCKPGQSLSFKASFTPRIWKNPNKSRFSAKELIFLPQEIKKRNSAWEVPICFATQFAEVPIPPEATSACGCSVKNSIPAIKETILKK